MKFKGKCTPSHVESVDNLLQENKSKKPLISGDLKRERRAML